MIAFATPILAARGFAGRSSWLLRILMAFLLVCSLLSHGATLFALMGIILFSLIRHRRHLLKEICLIGLITLVLYCPWIGYRKLVDPPGDRLLKYHLAGVEQVTTEPVLKTIFEAYRRLTVGQWLSIRRSNVAQVFIYEISYLKEVPKFTTPESKRALRVMEFFYLMPAVGFAGLGIVCLLFGWTRTKRPNEIRAARRVLLWSFTTFVPWLVLMANFREIEKLLGEVWRATGMNPSPALGRPGARLVLRIAAD